MDGRRPLKTVLALKGLSVSNSKQNPTDGRIIGPKRKPGVDSEQKILLSVDDVAALLNCSPRHIWRLASSGRAPRPLRLGGLRRWRREAIDQWLADGCPSVRGGQR
jgi:excisionase family DNA binding protein